MKKIIIIDVYPSNKGIENTLSECIDRLSNTGYDIMITSHLPISNRIQEKVDYCIYDKENILLPFDLTPYSWYSTESFDLRVNNSGHSITICKNIFNGISMAKSLGYDFFYFIEFDNLFSTDDIEKLKKIENDMFINNKSMLFFKRVFNGQQGDSEFVYETLIFGGVPSYFLDNVKLPLSLEEFIDYDMNTILEFSFYDKLKNKESDFYIIESSSKEYFSNSVINKFSQNSYICELVGNNIDDKLVLWTSNEIVNDKSINIKIGSDEEYTLQPGGWTYRYINIDNNARCISIEIDDGIYVTKKEFVLDNISKYYEKGKISFKNK